MGISGTAAAGPFGVGVPLAALWRTKFSDCGFTVLPLDVIVSLALLAPSYCMKLERLNLWWGSLGAVAQGRNLEMKEVRLEFSRKLSVALGCSLCWCPKP